MSVYVVGHKNPDTDSVVAAMAYARLRCALGDREYVAARAGHINDETKRMLDYFGMEPPLRIHDLKTQVCDLEYDTPPALTGSVTMEFAWDSMRKNKIATMPILNDDGTLLGMISAGDMATYDMDTVKTGTVGEVPLFNIISVLEGRLVNGFANSVDCVSGKVEIALPDSYGYEKAFTKDSIVICGSQPDIIKLALSAGVSCLILCRTEVPKELESFEGPTAIVSSPLDARHVARLIFQAVPVSKLCHRDNIVSFRLTDYIDTVREVVLKSRFRCYPILDENEKVVGTLSRYHLLAPKRKNVVLVDHNEMSQAVNGLEQANVMEIIDHHRLADIQTLQPISFRNEPVGSTNTIITEIYQEAGVVPSPDIAGLMAAAILSDTVMFKSPTCTPKDRAMAERLSRIAGVSLDSIGKELFSNSGVNKSASELFSSDYKVFHLSELNVGVSQITCVDSGAFLERKDEFLQIMKELREKEGFDLVLLMFTDVLKEGTHLLYLGSDDLIENAFGIKPHENQLFLPGVMSRKKQIIPMLTAVWG